MSPRWLGFPLMLAGCVTLDGFIYNPVHCSTVGPDTCEGHGEWNGLCLACETPYDWSRSYPWTAETLSGGEPCVGCAPPPPITIRPVPDGVVVREQPETDDGLATLDAYWLPSHGGDPALAGTTVIYNHGNYGGIEHYQPRVRILWELGFNVYVWDYRGYGKTEPDTLPTAEQFMADARQIRAHVVGLAPDPDRVLIYGYSLGGLPAVEMAVADPGCALVLEAPFTSPQAIARSNATVGFPDSFLSEGRFDNIRKIRDYPGPLLTMIGTADKQFPPDEVRRIAEAAPGPSELWILDGVAHGVDPGGIVEAGIAPYRNRVRGFLEQQAPACLPP